MPNQAAGTQIDRDPTMVAPPQFTSVTRTGGATQPATSTTVGNIPAGGRMWIQNVSNANELYVKLGTAASTTSFDFKLPACTVATAAGIAAPFLIADYVGPVTVAGTTPTYVATILS